MKHRSILMSICALVTLLIGGWRIPPALPGATITVTTTADGIANDGACSLREAVIAANTDSAVGGCLAGSGADTIQFDAELPAPAIFVLTLSGKGEDNAQTGDLDIAGTLTIQGAGLGNTILDGNAADRVLEILPGTQVIISGVTVRDGNPGVGAHGGGILIEMTGKLTLSDSLVSANTASQGGGVKVLGGLTANNSTISLNQGGGILNDAGLLNLSNVSVLDNQGGYGVRNTSIGSLIYQGGTVDGNVGGGIYNASSTASLSSLIITNNTQGGGVHNSGSLNAKLSLANSTLANNSASSGGGVFNQGLGAVASIKDTYIHSNTASLAGGGVYNQGMMMTIERSAIANNSARTGGGIDHSGNNLSLVNVTVSQNTVSDNGGGIYNRNNATLNHVTVAYNTAGGPESGANLFVEESEIAFQNTIVANSVAEGNCFNSAGTIHSLGYNMESGNSCEFSGTGDQVSTDPKLGPLQDNGGLTPTHALLTGSPAKDHSDGSACPDTDQRGVARPQGSACDSGAFEVIPNTISDLSIIMGDTPDPVVAGEPLSYQLEITNNGPDPAIAIKVIDALPAGVDFQKASGAGWTCDPVGLVVTCTKDLLVSSSTSILTIEVIAPLNAGTIKNTATVSAFTTDPDLDNNSAMVQTRVNPGSIYSEIFIPIVCK